MAGIHPFGFHEGFEISVPSTFAFPTCCISHFCVPLSISGERSDIVCAESSAQAGRCTRIARQAATRRMEGEIEKFIIYLELPIQSMPLGWRMHHPQGSSASHEMRELLKAVL